ncbi:MAG TPA: hypothetical protein VHX66_12185 [Solirubrobacteraceae bacterium]|jgi:hypothetical protein|nr:hypothetical protein [Solirubrobacteraceae bacterium]
MPSVTDTYAEELTQLLDKPTPVAGAMTATEDRISAVIALSVIEIRRTLEEIRDAIAQAGGF